MSLGTLEPMSVSPFCFDTNTPEKNKTACVCTIIKRWSEDVKPDLILAQVAHRIALTRFSFREVSYSSTARNTETIFLQKNNQYKNTDICEKKKRKHDDT